jgi:hypothetical protein
MESLNKRLLDAVDGGDFDRVKQLLTGGADVSAKGEQGETPLQPPCSLKKPLGRF